MDLRAANAIEAVLGRWSEGPGPLHRKLTDALRQAIERGHLAVGERLPSERDLASRLAVSRSTVVSAYDVLRAEGVVESRQGSGTRVRGDRGPSVPINPTGVPLSSVYHSLLNQDDSLISLTTAVFPAHPRAVEAIAAVATQADEVFYSRPGYSPAGLPELRESIAELLIGEGTPTNPDQVVVTTGAQQAVYLANALFVRPGDEVVVESPSYAGTLDIFRARGARLSPVHIDDDGIDARTVADIVAARRASAVYVMPSFHNPTGVMMSAQRRRALADLAGSERTPIIEDNALDDFRLDDTDHPPPIAAYASPDAPVLSAGSLSKTSWGGLRLGWLRGPEPLISRVGEMKAMIDLGSPMLEQAVAVRLIPHLPELRADHQAQLRRNLKVLTELLTEVLPDWHWRQPKGGPSLWVRLPTGNAAAFAQVAMRYGVEVVPGDVMSPGIDHRDCMRFPYTLEPPVLEETVRRLAAAWHHYAPSGEVRRRAGGVVV
jgi:DNA-binding transcriptional MocR family regulator